jgi:predicted metal-dependent hydrolase
VAVHREWIERTRHRALQVSAVVPVSPVLLPVSRLELRALGENWPLDHQVSAGPARLRELSSLDSAEQMPRLLLRSRAGDQVGMRAALIAWLRERLHERANVLLPSLAASMGVEYRRIRTGCQRSRWGSCSRRGTVSLNCCLLFQRPEVLRYLLVHELAHRRHMNHSAQFWQFVARYEADWRALDRELSRGWQHVPRWMFASGHQP